MAAQCLLLCEDAELAAALRSTLDELGMEIFACTRQEPAMRLLGEQRFDLLMADWEAEGAAQVMLTGRLTGHNRYLVTVAVVGSASAMQAAQAAGTNFVVCKPVMPDAVTRTLRAAASLFVQSGPRHPRRLVHALSFVSLESSQEAAILLNVSESGLALQALEPLEKGSVVEMKIELPAPPVRVQARGEIMWSDASGRAGVRFVELSSDALESLKGWLATDAAQQAAGTPQPEPQRGTAVADATPNQTLAAAGDVSVVLLAYSLFAILFLVATPAPPSLRTALIVTLGAIVLLGGAYLGLFRFLKAPTAGKQIAEVDPALLASAEAHNARHPAPPALAREASADTDVVVGSLAGAEVSDGN